MSRIGRRGGGCTNGSGLIELVDEGLSLLMLSRSDEASLELMRLDVEKREPQGKASQPSLPSILVT